MFSVHLKVHIPEIRQKHTHFQKINKHHYHPKKVYYDYSFGPSIEFENFKTPFRKRKHISDYEIVPENDHFISHHSFYKPPEDNMLETIKFLQDFYDKHKKKSSASFAEPPEEDYSIDLSQLESSKYSVDEDGVDWKSSTTPHNYRHLYMDNIWTPYSGFNWKSSLMDRKRRHSNVNEPIGIRYKYY